MRKRLAVLNCSEGAGISWCYQSLMQVWNWVEGWK
jgi:hypothetical protein